MTPTVIAHGGERGKRPRQLRKPAKASCRVGPAAEHGDSRDSHHPIFSPQSSGTRARRSRDALSVRTPRASPLACRPRRAARLMRVDVVISSSMSGVARFGAPSSLAAGRKHRCPDSAPHLFPSSGGLQGSPRGSHRRRGSLEAWSKLAAAQWSSSDPPGLANTATHPFRQLGNTLFAPKGTST